MLSPRIPIKMCVKLHSMNPPMRVPIPKRKMLTIPKISARTPVHGVWSDWMIKITTGKENYEFQDVLLEITANHRQKCRCIFCIFLFKKIYSFFYLVLVCFKRGGSNSRWYPKDTIAVANAVPGVSVLFTWRFVKSLSDYQAFHHIQLRNNWQDDFRIVKVLALQRNKGWGKRVLEKCETGIDCSPIILLLRGGKGFF